MHQSSFNSHKNKGHSPFFFPPIMRSSVGQCRNIRFRQLSASHVIITSVDVCLWLPRGSRCFQRAPISKRGLYIFFYHEKALCHPCCTRNSGHNGVMEHSFSINCSAIFSCCFLLNRDLLLGFESRLHFGRPVSPNEASMKSLLGSAPHYSLQWLL